MHVLGHCGMPDYLANHTAPRSGARPKADSGNSTLKRQDTSHTVTFVLLCTRSAVGSNLKACVTIRVSHSDCYRSHCQPANRNQSRSDSQDQAVSFLHVIPFKRGSWISLISRSGRISLIYRSSLSRENMQRSCLAKPIQ
jgi:hypothetical protein